MNADTRTSPGHFAGNQLQKTSGARLLLPKSASPGMELMPVDVSIPTKVGNVHAASCLALDESAPMGSSFLFGHYLLPPDKRKSFFLGGYNSETNRFEDGYIERLHYPFPVDFLAEVFVCCARLPYRKKAPVLSRPGLFRHPCYPLYGSGHLPLSFQRSLSSSEISSSFSHEGSTRLNFQFISRIQFFLKRSLPFPSLL